MLAERQSCITNTTPNNYDFIIVGTGPVGVRMAQALLKNNGAATIALFGNEPWKPYNRIHLSSLITGEQKEETIYTQTDFSNHNNLSTFYNQPIIDINRSAKIVTDDHGNQYGYRNLILATGSRPHVPDIEGKSLKNVFTFRDLSDAQNLMSRSVSSRRTVIIGGGLLGLEAARTMQRFNTHVSLIEHNIWLMFSQLDQRAGSYLKQHVEALGIHVYLGHHATEIIGENKVEGIFLNNNEFVECDTVIIATGITPNIELARKAGLAIGRGIRVNDQLQTSDPAIYAIGECAEHKGKVYGLVGPGFEQASVLSHTFMGERVQYKGTVMTSQLKIIDYPVFSIGNNGHSVRQRETFIYQDHAREIYRKIVVVHGRLRGMIAIGELQGCNRLQQAVSQQRRIWPWHIRRFKEKGSLWLEDDLENVLEWPANAVVCNCTGVTRGQLEKAQMAGARTLTQLSHDTGASTVCGSCRHLLSNFIGSHVAATPVKAYKQLLFPSLIGVFLSLCLLLLPGVLYNASAQDINWDSLWRNNLYKQLSGFSLLAFSLLISVISIRKRLRSIIQKWDFAYWRITHVIVGVSLLLLLLVHSGFRFGHNLNFYLMLVFSSLLLSGAIAGITIAMDHTLSRKTARRLRTFSIWSHIILLWPLPALLGFHVLKTYYF